MSEISITRELASDLNAFYGSGFRSLLEEKFNAYNVKVTGITTRDLVGEDIFHPQLIKVDSGERFDLQIVSRGPGQIEFVLEKAK